MASIGTVKEKIGYGKDTYVEYRNETYLMQYAESPC